ncbi:exodeoxyribonuclease III [Curvivirga aplysinae]|uniref:exodeoxyribonuclease III n=1 Tax=Curvivirga aplysinae TaxID=2529852 RepID=UPI0012BCAC85|nr:exodeoxyribonuclease III [Curvivirga aplysinae]MTI09885.1 exodeoxyribonuclease III [Curvivirga aplysinae]
MRLVTWNINSIRQRLHLLRQLDDEYNPDVVCFQETKAQNTDFPMEDIKALGFPHVYIVGMKGYNGVAICSKLPLENETQKDWVGKSDCRHQSVTLPNGIEVHNFYVPAGGDEPNPEANEKFDHKLKFLAEMTDWFPAEKDNSKPMILVGDLNIAPLEEDVWSHKQLLKVVSHTPIEVEALNKVMDAFGWVDAMRQIIPTPEKLYSWWSYRSRDWRKANKGRRLDHIWITEPLKDKVKDLKVIVDARGWEKPSDHAPVLIELED